MATAFMGSLSHFSLGTIYADEPPAKAPGWKRTCAHCTQGKGGSLISQPEGDL